MISIHDHFDPTIVLCAKLDYDDKIELTVENGRLLIVTPESLKVFAQQLLIIAHSYETSAETIEE